MYPRLGVNIDHVATIRQARGEHYPSIERAAEASIKSGADQITIHLREDRRHIQDSDLSLVRKVTKDHNKLLNLEMACTQEMIDIAKKTDPEWICLVPEKREEKTTEGGINLNDDKIFKNVLETCQTLKVNDPSVKISLFLEANNSLLPRIKEIDCDAVEVHTGNFSKNFLARKDTSLEVKSFKDFSIELKGINRDCHAGHGLTLEMLPTLLEQKFFLEYNIGHWIIAEAIFSGLNNVVSDVKNVLEQFRFN